MKMTPPMLFVACTCSLLLASLVSSNVVEHTLIVENRKLSRLCTEQEVTLVNGSLPGPVIHVREGDSLIVHVINQSPVNISLHWHGLFQRRTGWADGAAYVTQCPMVPGSNYTYRFNITDQRGTLWWHSHRAMSRATVYGAFIIHPKPGQRYPYPKPDKEVPIVFGEWWNGNIAAIDNQGFLTGLGPNLSDAFTINGKPGDLYPCPKKDTFKLKVKPDNVYLLRLVNAAVNNQLFFKIANHNLTVVGIDALYTQPYHTDVVVIAPGQTVDVLLIANRTPNNYYMAIHPYASSAVPFDNTTATAIMEYEGATPSATPEMPILPAFNDTPTAHKFYSNLTSPLRQVEDLPLQVDERIFIAIGMSMSPCGLPGNATCLGINGTRFSANMNLLSFQLPTSMSILQAHWSGAQKGVFTADFPNHPPLIFDFTNAKNTFKQAFMVAPKTTRVKKIPFNSSVEIVFQNTIIMGVENHPIHLHGYDFYVLAMGFGNYNPVQDSKKFNLFNPQKRNTVAVPAGGWAVIRFQADNPGAWIMHCHLETHLAWGLATVLVVEEGPTPFYQLPPPPSDYPQC